RRASGANTGTSFCPSVTTTRLRQCRLSIQTAPLFIAARIRIQHVERVGCVGQVYKAIIDALQRRNAAPLFSWIGDGAPSEPALKVNSARLFFSVWTVKITGRG